MTIVGWLQIGLLLLVVLALIKPLGLYMARVFSGERTFLSPVLGPLEHGFYLAGGIDPKREQGWLGYATGMLLFSAAGFALLYAILRLQGLLPLNPQGFGGVAPAASTTSQDYRHAEKRPLAVPDLANGLTFCINPIDTDCGRMFQMSQRLNFAIGACSADLWQTILVCCEG